MLKQYFARYQKSLVEIANTSVGRHLLSVKSDEQIVKLTPNSYHQLVDFKKGQPIIQATFFTASKVAKMLQPILDKMLIAEEYITNKDKAIEQYAGLRDWNYPQVYLASPLTVYTGAGDGLVEYDGTASWATIHDAVTGTTADPTGTTGRAQTQEVGGTSRYIIRRSFLPFDTSGIGLGNTVSAAILSLYTTSTANGDHDGDDFIAVVQTSQPSNTTFTTADYDLVGDAISNPTEGATRVSFPFTTTQYNSFTLNATGLSWITLDGFSKLGVREGHDVINSAIANSAANTLTFSTSEEAGTSQDPKLVVTYALTPSATTSDTNYSYFL